MPTTVEGLRAPIATDPFQPHTDMANLRDDIAAQMPIARGNLAFGAVVGVNAVQSGVPTARLQATGVTPGANRIVNVRAAVHIYNPGTGVFVSGRIARDGTQVGTDTQVWHPGGGAVIRVAHEADDLGPTAAAHTYEYQLWTTSGGLTYDPADASMRIADEGGI